MNYRLHLATVLTLGVLLVSCGSNTGSVSVTLGESVSGVVEESTSLVKTNPKKSSVLDEARALMASKQVNPVDVDGNPITLDSQDPEATAIFTGVVEGLPRRSTGFWRVGGKIVWVLRSTTLPSTPVQVGDTIQVSGIAVSNTFFIAETISRPGTPPPPPPPVPTLSVNDVTVNENAGNATFTVSLSSAASQNVSFNFATSNGTATAGSDYTATNVNRTINAGSTSTTITVPILEDQLDEPDETFNVTVSNPINVTIADGTGIGTIVDNDPALPPGTISMTPGQSRVFTLTYDNAGDTPTEDGELFILIGSELIVDSSTMKDQFLTNTTSSPMFPVISSVLSVPGPFVWGSSISYCPLSATNPSSPSGRVGLCDVNIPPSFINGSRGVFTFSARLKPDILQRYSCGAILDPDHFNGMIASLRSSNSPNIPAELRILISCQ